MNEKWVDHTQDLRIEMLKSGQKCLYGLKHKRIKKLAKEIFNGAFIKIPSVMAPKNYKKIKYLKLVIIN